MSAADILHLSLVEQGELIAARRISASELTEAYLERIAAVDDELRSFVTVTADRALADAVRADRELAAGGARGPLHGIPVAVKDLFATAGILTTANSPTLADEVPTADATVVARLRDAGAVLLGKLQMNELAMGPVFEDDARPPARNPWDVTRATGGSSSGSAAALAAALCSGSYGSDTGGSIRAPAAYCGVVGLKPSQGLVSRSGVTMLSWSLDHVGPMARRVADVALLLQATAGHDPADSTSAARPVPDWAASMEGGLAGIRVGVPTSVIDDSGATEEMVHAFDSAVSALEDLGAAVHPIELPLMEHLDGIFNPIMFAEAASYHEATLRDGRHGRGFTQRALQGFLYTAVDYVQAQRGRRRLVESMRARMADVDVIVTPTVSGGALPVEEYVAAPRSPFTRFFNLTGQPSLSLPCGFDANGMPLGLMVSGRRFEDATVLKVAAAYERSTPWHQRRPPARGDDPHA